MNVLLIAIDTLRADHLSCYGFSRLTSPHLDRFAAQGAVFEQFIAPHIPTHPGYTSLFTGKDVFSHQIVSQGGAVELDTGVKTLPEILQQRGFFTAAADNLGRWFRRGFELYQGYEWTSGPDGGLRKAEAVNLTAFQMLDACVNQSKPWFLFVHYWDPHTPYLPPPPFSRMFYHDDETAERHTSALKMMNDYPAFQWYFREWMPGCRDVEFPKAQYDAEIAYCDACLGRLLHRLDETGVLGDTLVVITADHGEELDEHEMWFDHHGLYETNIHVPLIMVQPGRIKPGLRLPGLTRHQDLAPTILELVGLRGAADEHCMEGQSLVPMLDQPGHAGTCDAVYLTECAWMKKRGLRTGRWKLIECLYDELHKRPPLELYDLATDPGEQVNLAEVRPDVLEALRGQLARHVEARLAETGLPDPHTYQHITMTQVSRPPEGA